MLASVVTCRQHSRRTPPCSGSFSSTFKLSNLSTCKPFQITSLADPRTLTPSESHPYKKDPGATSAVSGDCLNPTGHPLPLSAPGNVFLCNNAAILPLYFQQLPGCPSRNPFVFKLLHCCRGVGRGYAKNFSARTGKQTRPPEGGRIETLGRRLLLRFGGGLFGCFFCSGLFGGGFGLRAAVPVEGEL